MRNDTGFGENFEYNEFCKSDFEEGDFETQYLKILEKGLIGNIREHIRLI